ncbi:DUF4384 domain-containing protein [Runella sp. MFBS21]|uniref:DUF4384 domain-containing protein n=1 Tax=Runella sp. MFBS21 TaxID=3034018 RepID=UPI0023F9BB61|nr:DUF4384 domain-containing protein [Runella sp. MFBS21]MDF7821820.1 DUF4384 domain-containing protein [Runella sp. MFBS21]
MNFSTSFPRLLLAFVLWTSCLAVVAQNRPQTKDYTKRMGMKIDDNKYLQSPKKSQNIKYRGVLPSRKTLTQFMPTIFDQGETGSCVGQSVGLVRTIMEAQKRRLTTTASIDPYRFSPYYIYEQIKGKNDYDCQDGATIPDALYLLKNKGAALLSCMPNACDANYTKCDAEAAQYKIEDFTALFDVLQLPTETKILKIKEALAEGEQAVPIGMLLPRSFFSATDEWRSAPGESPENALGGHAMAIIGYDDTRYGGAFLIANSWGAGWGNNGYTWGRYEDVARFTRYAFQVFPAASVVPVPPGPGPSPAVSLKSDMSFQLSGTNAEMPVVLVPTSRGIDVTNDNANTDLITYQMTSPYSSGTRFKMAMNNSRQAYVYIIASDDVNRVTKLFPYQGELSQNVSAIVPPNSSVLLPAADQSFTMDTVTGTDYFLVLVSEKELNIEALSSAIKNGSGNFVKKVLDAIKTDMTPSSDITYQPTKVAFEVKGNPKGSIVPMLVRIVHK